MDTHSINLPLPEAEALRRALDQVAGGSDAVLAVQGEAPGLLDSLAGQLAGLPSRVLRVAASGRSGLSLSGLMAQVTGRLDLEAHDDDVLERGFQALTAGGGEGGAVTLLVEGASGLQRTALRYIQFACRSGPALRLVLVDGDGEPGVLHDAALLSDELSYLRTRLAAYPVISVAGAAGLLARDAAFGVLPDEAGAEPFSVEPPPVQVAVPVAVQPVPLPPSRPQLVVSSLPAPPGVPLPGAVAAGTLRAVLMPDRPAVAHMAPAPLESASPELPAGPAPAAAPQAGPTPDDAPSLAASRRRPPALLWAAALIGMAASVAAGVVVGRQGWLVPPVRQPAANPVAPATASAAPPVTADTPQASEPPAAPGVDSGHEPGLAQGPGTGAAAPGAVSAAPERADAVPPPQAPAEPPAVPQPPAAVQAASPAVPEAAPPQAPQPPTQAEGRVPRRRAAGRARQAEAQPDDRADAHVREPAARQHRASSGSGARGGAGARPRPLPPEADDAWQAGSAAPWAEPGGRGVVGTYSVDPNGMRVFRSAQ